MEVEPLNVFPPTFLHNLVPGNGKFKKHLVILACVYTFAFVCTGLNNICVYPYIVYICIDKPCCNINRSVHTPKYCSA